MKKPRLTLNHKINDIIDLLPSTPLINLENYNQPEEKLLNSPKSNSIFKIHLSITE